MRVILANSSRETFPLSIAPKVAPNLSTMTRRIVSLSFQNLAPLSRHAPGPHGMRVEYNANGRLAVIGQNADAAVSRGDIHLPRGLYAGSKL